MHWTPQITGLQEKPVEAQGFHRLDIVDLPLAQQLLLQACICWTIAIGIHFQGCPEHNHFCAGAGV